MSRNAITNEAVRELLEGREDNTAKAGRDLLIGGISSAIGLGANYFTGLGLPEELAGLLSFTIGMYLYRELRARNLLPAAPK